MLHDIDAERLEVVGGLAGRILDKLEFPGKLTLTTDREQRRRRRLLRARAAAGRRAARRGLKDETIPPKFGCIGQETTGAGRLRQGAAHRAGGARHRRRHAPAGRAGRLAARLHQPRRARHPGAARPRPPCDRALQHPDRLPARCSPSSSASSPARVQLEHVGLNHLSWERGVLVDGGDRLPGADRRVRRPAGRGGRPARRPDPAAAARSPPTTCATSTSPSEALSDQAERPAAGGGGDGDRARPAGDVRATRRST